MEKAVRWNPTNATIAFEYAESFKIIGDLERFYEISKGIFKYAFRSADVARCYRNLAFYFVENELWSEAIGCNIMSLQYDKESKNAQSELYYIQQKTHGQIKEPSLDDMKEYGKKYGFPIGADNDVLGMAYAYGKHFFDQKEEEPARYFFTILYNLTEDQQIKELLDQLPKTKQ